MRNPTTERLMQLHAAVLFTYNATGRMLQANGPWPDRGPAPRFFLGVPVTGTPVRRYREDIPEALVQALETVAIPEATAGASVCRSVRITAAHEAGIDTLAPFRGKGYAAAALALWAVMVRDMGALPLYSTSWSNNASRNLSRKAGLICYGSTLSVS